IEDEDAPALRVAERLSLQLRGGLRGPERDRPVRPDVDDVPSGAGGGAGELLHLARIDRLALEREDAREGDHAYSFAGSGSGTKRAAWGPPMTTRPPLSSHACASSDPSSPRATPSLRLASCPARVSSACRASACVRHVARGIRRAAAETAHARSSRPVRGVLPGSPWRAAS